MSRQVHYVDFFISCCLLRYRQQRKPLGDLDIKKIRGKLSLEILVGERERETTYKNKENIRIPGVYT
jgi:hypothetical protein